ncbi:MAG TPA: NUDIX domain-containing protein [Pyrinomonadaceae bacterium]|nr:NUDIX domain-containing protein [Pyrinomonadaceae bacterium]
MKDEKPDKSPKLRTVEQISAGGVAFRYNEGEAEIAIISAKPGLRWQLPKGIIDAGETPEIAALREVREEAGIETELLSEIETIEYWYVGDNRGERVRFHKLVHFFLLKYSSGDVADHDYEVAEARWVKLNEVLEMLAFKGEKGVARKAVDSINEFVEKRI